MEFRNVAFIKYYPIFVDKIQDSEYNYLYFNVIDTFDNILIYETCIKIKSFKLKNYEMLFNPIISILSGDFETNHQESIDEIKLIFDIDFIFLFDGTINHDSDPYLINQLQSKISCPICGLCKKVIKHIEPENKFSFTDKYKNNICISNKDIKEPIPSMKTMSVKDAHDKEYMIIININSKRQPIYRFVIPSFNCDLKIALDIIRKNITGKQIIFENYANTIMKEIMNSKSKIKI